MVVVLIHLICSLWQVFEFTPGGLVYPQAKYTPLKVILYDTPQDEVRMAFEIITGVFTLIYTIRFFREVSATHTTI